MKSFTVQCCAVLAVVVSVVMGRAVTKKHNSIHYWEQVQHEAQNLLKQNVRKTHVNSNGWYLCVYFVIRVFSCLLSLLFLKLIDVEVYYLRNPSTCVVCQHFLFFYLVCVCVVMIAHGEVTSEVNDTFLYAERATLFGKGISETYTDESDRRTLPDLVPVRHQCKKIFF